MGISKGIITTLQETISEVLGCLWLDLSQRDDAERHKVGATQLDQSLLAKP